MSATEVSVEFHEDIRKTTAIQAFAVFGFLFLNPLWVFGICSFVGEFRLRTWAKVLATLSLTLFMCNRKFGGTHDDVPMYAYLFQASTTHTLHYLVSNWTFEPGFILVTKLIALLVTSRKAYLLLIFFLINFLVVHAAGRFSRKYAFFVLLCYFATFGGVFFDHIRALRQTLALGLVLCGIGELMQSPTRSLKPYVYLVLAPLIHVSALPVSAAFVVTKMVWNKSRLLMVLGATGSFVVAYTLSNLLITVAYGVSSRIQIYQNSDSTYQISPFQIAIAAFLSVWLLSRGIIRRSETTRGPLWYCGGVLGICLLGIFVSGKLPDQLISRELIFLLGILTMLASATLRSDRDLRLLMIPVVLFELGRAAIWAFNPPDQMMVMTAHGALYPWSGMVSNGIDYFSNNVQVPAYYAEGGL
jgi:hypothetical protein